MTTIHTRQLQQYTQDNYNNTHKTTNNNTHILQQIHIRWQQYTQDNYNNTYKTNDNNTHKTTTKIHTRQLQKSKYYSIKYTGPNTWENFRCNKLITNTANSCTQVFKLYLIRSFYWREVTDEAVFQINLLFHSFIRVTTD